MNHLSHERSLYLQQHAHNPVDWYAWGAEALQRSVEQDRPIFLSIGYSSCHWCHVMEHEVFEHDDVAALLNEHFVCIKVDREERPDLDAVYMEAVQLMTGGGGWPMTVFLTPSLKPFFGATYVPHGPFLQLASRIAEVFRARRQELEEQAQTVASSIAADLSSNRPLPVEASLVDAVAHHALELYDPQNGGFRSRAKFPTPLRWAFLLHHYRKTGERSELQAVVRTLDAMRSGGLRDHVGGGFHRYAVDPGWLVPHFEKMLYDNAQLASLYVEAASVLGVSDYAQVARDTLDFLLRDMAEPDGGFCASYDADSGGEEGSFYVWTPSEMAEIAGAHDGPALAMLLGATERGNFEGKSVLTRTTEPAAVAEVFQRSVPEIEALFDRWRPALLQARASRTWPTRDHKVVTSWNGLAIAALSQGHAVLGCDAWIASARGTAQLLWELHRRADGSLLRASNGGIPTGEGILDDYGFFAWGLLELHQATGETVWFDRALALVDHAIEQFSHPQGGFYLTAKSVPAPLGRKQLAHDAVEPSGQSMMVQCLLRLGLLTGRDSYEEAASQALQAHAHLLESNGVEMAWWADAALRSNGPRYEVVIAGQGDALTTAFGGLAAPHAVMLRVASQGPDPGMLERFPATQGKRGEGVAFVCRQGACNAPTNAPEELKSQLKEGWSA
jgi:uncharacterized protein